MKKLIIYVMALLFSTSAFAQAQSFSGSLKEGDGSAKKVLEVYIDVQPEKRDAFLEIMLELLHKSQTEEGCLEYTLWADLKSPNCFFLHEEYKDAQAFKTHQESEHFQNFVKKRLALGGVVMRGKINEVTSATHKPRQSK